MIKEQYLPSLFRGPSCFLNELLDVAASRHEIAAHPATGSHAEFFSLSCITDLNLWNKSISQRWRKLRRRCSVQESSEPQEALIQGGTTQGVIQPVRSSPASRESSPAAKSLQDGSSPKKLLQTSSLRLPGNLPFSFSPLANKI